MKHKDNLKVAVDARSLVSGDAVRGIGVYVRELVNSFKDVQDVKNSKVTIELLTDHRSLFTNRYDIVHFTSFKPFETSVPFSKPTGTKFVLTIYDLIPLIYPKHYPPGIRGRIKFLINKYLINKNIDAVITISETSKKDICRFLEVNPNIVHVVYLAPRPIFKKMENARLPARQGKWKLEIAKRYNLPERFALYVGDINYNKNIPGLVDACKIAKIPLVIAGKQVKEIEKLDLHHQELVHLKNIDWNGVVRLGFVPDSDLVSIYNLATVYAHPSYYEGFGLPAVEAVACGTPIAIAKSQCMVEVMGDTFDYYDPKDANSMAKAMLAPNINKKLPREYSWKKTAEETMNIYRRV